MAALLVACSGSGASTPAAAASASVGAGAAGAVTIKDFAFGPASLSVPVGTTVTWTNGGSARHTVTAVDGSFDSKPIAGGGTFSQAFPKAGTYAYHCTIHSSMTATIVVK
jgi:plastocyanin